MYLITCLILLYLERLDQAVCSFSPFSHVILEKETRSWLQRPSLAFGWLQEPSSRGKGIWGEEE